MKKLYISLITSLFVISSWAVAEEAELLDAYLEDLPSTSMGASTGSGSAQANQSVIVGQPVEIVVDENGVSREVVQPQTVQYRRIQSADGSELYEAVPVAGSVTSEPVTSQPVIMESSTGVVMAAEVDVNSSVDAQEGMQVIELEPVEEEYVVIEAPDNSMDQASAKRIEPDRVNNQASISGHAFCQQNPYARECLLSKYLSLCKKDPQSLDCKSELQKFDNFCGTFPNAYKCKKAKIAATCKENPGSGECKTFTQRYCQKFPKAIFCDYN